MCSNIVFGLLPGWWRNTELAHQEGPLMSDSQWEKQLVSARFEPRLHIQDTDIGGDGHEISAFIAHSRSEVDPSKQARNCVILHSSSCNPSVGLAQRLADTLEDECKWKCSVAELEKLTPELLNALEYVCLVDPLDSIDLSELTEQTFQSIQLLLGTCQNLLWVTGDPDQRPKAAMVSGLVRTMRWERHGDAANVITLGIHDPLVSLNDLHAEIAHTCREAFSQDGMITKNTELILRNGVYLTARLSPAKPVDSCLNTEEQFVVKQHALGSAKTPLRLTLYESTPLNKLGFVTVDGDAAPGQHEVNVEVRAVHLTHQELAHMNELVPGKSIGKDGAGVVTAVGSSVSNFQSGNSVMFIGNVNESRGTFGTSLTLDQHALAKIPIGMSFSEAATTPFALCTAYHALLNIANLKPWHNIVVLDAAGALGQAAIQIAKRIGATILALVTNSKDKQFLVGQFDLQLSHVLCIEEDDCGFVPDRILSLTAGKGADVSLCSGSFQSHYGHSSRWTSQFGHVIYVQQTQSSSSSQDRLAPDTASNITSSYINMDDLQKHRPGHLIETFEAVSRMIAEGGVLPLQPIQAMLISHVRTAAEKARKGEDLERAVFLPEANDIIPVDQD